MKKSRALPPYLILAAILIASAVLSVAVGSVFIPLRTLGDVILSALRGVGSTLDPNGVYLKIITGLRLPHMLMLMLVGAALAGSGGAYQGLFRNPLADPFLIGISSGAGLGAVTVMLIRSPYEPGGVMTVPLAAFAGGVVTVGVVTMLARVGKTVPTTNLLLAGVAVSSFASALTSGLMIQSTGEVRRALVWLMGGAMMTGWQPLLGVAPYMALALTGLVLIGHPLNVLQFGEEQAQQLGIRVQQVRWITILLATLATAAAVAFAGIIGFVGLVVPHIIRLVWGGDYRRLIPLSMLGGASMLLLADVAARTVIAPQEVPVGIVTALLGAPFFLWILKRSKAQNYW
ncbi:MAG: iron ABC transporter permease [Anaerolineaceae bacterium]|jgi:iron complex transport system permease protein